MEHDLAAEKAIALTLVRRPEAWDYCGDLLTPEMFGDSMARKVFSAVRSLVMSAEPVTPVTVAAEMDGSAIPAWNRGDALRTEEVGKVAWRIRDLWVRRELVAAGERIATTAKDDPDAALREMAEAQNRVQYGGGGAKSMAQLARDLILEEKAESEKPGSARYVFETGYEKLDRHLGGFRSGELVVLAARPGGGKSSFVTGLLDNLARQGVPCGAFWLEDEWRDAVRRHIARRCRIPMAKLKGGPRVAYEALADERVTETAANLWVDDTHGLTIDDVCARMRRMNREHGVRLFVADHLGEIKLDRSRRWGERHDLALAECVRQYRDTAKELQAVPVVCVQMNRAIEKRGEGKKQEAGGENPKRPKLSDIEGSGGIEQAARIVLFLSQSKDNHGRHHVVVDVEKASTGEPGRSFMLRFTPEVMAVESA